MLAVYQRFRFKDTFSIGANVLSFFLTGPGIPRYQRPCLVSHFMVVKGPRSPLGCKLAAPRKGDADNQATVDMSNAPGFR